ncbi:MAG: ribosome maturation factor RimM, partial [Spirochaetales bacterium]
MTAEKLIIGIIRSSHGLTGNVKVASTSGEVEHFFNITEVTLKNGEIEKNFVVESVKGGSPTLYMKFKGIDSPEDAKTYFGWKILVPKTMACPLKEGEFYVEDLKGCSLIYCENDAHSKNNAKGASQKNASELLQKGIVVGSIADVLEGGANDLLEVVVSESLDAV